MKLFLAIIVLQLLCVLASNRQPKRAHTPRKHQAAKPAHKPEVHHKVPHAAPKKATTDTATCKSIVGYYAGEFKTKNPENKESIPVEFVLRLNANDADKKIQFSFDKWNSEKTDISTIRLMASNIDGWEKCKSPTEKCAIKYSTRADGDFVLDLQDKGKHHSWDSYNFLHFPKFNNTFTLQNAVGQCTKNHPVEADNPFTPDTNLFKYCLCCGDYKPAASLGCPEIAASEEPEPLD